ncbi:MAG: M15 family metallopeptidase [Agathobaculum sp.]|jgi:hypothetical protein|uniref:M15 family metallopeptidase n=1 Tax=Agathobaculum sp. TaxID=2048138 RepID=UPI003D92C6DA
MSHPILRGAGTIALLAAMLTPNANALSGISVWAQSDVAAAEAAGLAPSALTDLSAKEHITRAEFCGIALNTYRAVSGKAVFVSGKKPFRDCDDPNVAAAYELGLINGRGDAIFDPDATIERQDLCVMLYHVLEASDLAAPPIAGETAIEGYPDADSIKGYASQAVTTMADYAIINGISSSEGDTQLAPDGTATREQALIMANRFCAAFKPEKHPPHPAPDDASGMDADALPQTEAEKMAFVYGEGGEKYQTAEEAEANMVEIAVPVWRLQKDGSKTSDTAYMIVNQSLASVYQAVFEEIYNGDEQFPIKNVGCYAWRTGEHSQGTAVDINWEENMEATINADGSLTPTCGTHWLPYDDPYSIPEGGDVYNAFTKYGFSWGGNAWRSKRDYMHFSYFGR